MFQPFLERKVSRLVQQQTKRVAPSIIRLNFLFLVVSIIIKIQADNIFYVTVSYPPWSILRHIFFAMCLSLLGYLYIKLPKERRLFFGEFVIISTIIVIVFIISLFLISINDGSVTSLMKSIYFLYSPFLYAYFAINTLKKNDIEELFKWTFFSTIALYFFGNFSDFLDLNNFLEINFMESFSPFESSAFSGYFYGFMMFFTLGTDRKKVSILSVVMNILTFKRINVLFSIVFLFMTLSKKGYSKVPKIIPYIFILIFTLLPIIQYTFMNPDKLLYVASLLGFTDVHNLLMGRERFLYTVMNSGYRPSGFGSASSRLQAITGNGMEMDGLSTYIELGIIGTFLISFSFWKISGRIFRNVFLMLVFFFNYMTSTQLGDTYSLLLLFITIYFVKSNYSIKEQADLKIKEKK